MMFNNKFDDKLEQKKKISIVTAYLVDECDLDFNNLVSKLNF